MAEKKTCVCGKTYWSPGADWQHKDCVAATEKVPLPKRPVKAKKVKVAKSIEVPAGFVCPVCEANKAKVRARVKAYRLRKKSV